LKGAGNFFYHQIDDTFQDQQQNLMEELQKHNKQSQITLVELVDEIISKEKRVESRSPAQHRFACYKSLSQYLGYTSRVPLPPNAELQIKNAFPSESTTGFIKK
jgi:hypothetical protein